MRRYLFFALLLAVLAAVPAEMMAQRRTKTSKNRKTKTERTRSKPTAKPDGKQFVDLGLPSGTLWATMNVGASRPEDYGYYFAWGETTPKQSYDWSNYKWCNGAADKQIKYCTKSGYGKVDNKTELDFADDAAYVNWGPQWRMPSKEQQDELRAECNWQWTTRNGVNGYLVTSKRNSASLFLPAAGYRFEAESICVGKYGCCWSRTLDVENPDYAFDLYFGSDGVDWGSYDRYGGRSVRAVRVSQK